MLFNAIVIGAFESTTLRCLARLSPEERFTHRRRYKAAFELHMDRMQRASGTSRQRQHCTSISPCRKHGELTSSIRYAQEGGTGRVKRKGREIHRERRAKQKSGAPDSWRIKHCQDMKPGRHEIIFIFEGSSFKCWWPTSTAHWRRIIMICVRVLHSSSKSLTLLFLWQNTATSETHFRRQ